MHLFTEFISNKSPIKAVSITLCWALYTISWDFFSLVRTVLNLYMTPTFSDLFYRYYECVMFRCLTVFFRSVHIIPYKRLALHLNLLTF